MVGKRQLPRIVYHTTAAQLIYVQCKISLVVLPTADHPPVRGIVNGNIAAYKETGSLIQIFMLARWQQLYN